MLDAQTIGQIAAGEVIERPLSVVKELVENALDAGATRIAVRARGGGITEIDVADNGHGIAPDEVALAFARHGTSKLASAADLTSIATLGFRGEGLASIAAVARVTLISRIAGVQTATAVDAHGETLGVPRPMAAPPGTRVLVRDLFANVPARREYLRSPSAEFTRIAQWLATLALAYPAVGFSLDHDDRRLFAFPPGDDLGLRLAHVFGRGGAPLVALGGALADHRGARAACEVDGFISTPGDDRADRRAQIVFVNGRLLRTTALSGAWTAAYRTFAMVGRHPYGVLFLRVAPGDVDPNVHPTKNEVRFRYGERVSAAVREAMSAALRRGAQERLQRAISFAPPHVAAVTASPVARDASVPGGVQDALIDVAPAAGALRVLAQVDRTFILATDGNAVVLVDQHAAHERIVFEQLRDNARGTAASEPLLVPFVFEVSAERIERLDATLADLAAGGLEIERFGERAYRIVATPARLAHAGAIRRFDVAAFLDGLDDGLRGLDAAQRVWASLACHSVVRAGERLELAEMAALVERLPHCENPMHCPHGRPTIVRLESDALARLFKRL